MMTSPTCSGAHAHFELCQVGTTVPIWSLAKCVTLALWVGRVWQWAGLRGPGRLNMAAILDGIPVRNMWLESWRIVADMPGYFRNLVRGGSIIEEVGGEDDEGFS